MAGGHAPILGGSGEPSDGLDGFVNGFCCSAASWAVDAAYLPRGIKGGKEEVKGGKEEVLGGKLGGRRGVPFGLLQRLLIALIVSAHALDHRPPPRPHTLRCGLGGVGVRGERRGVHGVEALLEPLVELPSAGRAHLHRREHLRRCEKV